MSANKLPELTPATNLRPVYSGQMVVTADVVLTPSAEVKLTPPGARMRPFWVAGMLTQEQAVEVRVMARRGVKFKQIARELGISKNTVKRTCVTRSRR